MSNLNEHEEKKLYSREGTLALIIGYLKMEKGRIMPAEVTKITKKLGWDDKRISKDELVEAKEKIEVDPDLRVIFDKAVQREITLDDLYSVYGDKEVVTEQNFADIVTPHVKFKEKEAANIREFRKVQRDGTYMQIMMDRLLEELKEEFKDLPTPKYLETGKAELERGDKVIALIIGDLHIGALVFNKDTGGYSFEKLQMTMQSIMDYIAGLADDVNAEHIYLLNVGDSIEHVYMRNVDQAYDAEFATAQQISKATRFLKDIIQGLSQIAPVTYGMVAGNHDRIAGNKKDNIYNDNVAYVILENLFMIQEEGFLQNVTLIDNREDTSDFHVDIAGQLFYITHGDHENTKLDEKIPKHIKDRPIDVIVFGHFHKFGIIQEAYDRLQVRNGSTMPYNDYVKENNMTENYGSQTAMVLEHGRRTRMLVPMILKNGKVL